MKEATRQQRHLAFCRVITELVNDRDTRDQVQSVITRWHRQNKMENEKTTDAEIRKMILVSIMDSNPNLTPVEAEKKLERRLQAAYIPYKGTEETGRSLTAADMLRINRKNERKKNRHLRK